MLVQRPKFSTSHTNSTARLYTARILAVGVGLGIPSPCEIQSGLHIPGTQEHAASILRKLLVRSLTRDPHRVRRDDESDAPAPLSVEETREDPPKEVP